MNILIVVAHPDPKSFNVALALAARETLQSQGHHVRSSDLYAKDFAPDEHARHYSHRQNRLRFDALAEQRFSAEHDALPEDVAREVEDVLWAELLVLQFPLWWFGMPAILKGWMDRVFVYGKLYSGSRRLHSGVCRGKRAMLSVTAGASMEACSHNGQEGDTGLILWPINYSLHYLGFTALAPIILTGVRSALTWEDAGAHEQRLHEQLRRHAARFADLDAIPAIPFNVAEDWDQRRQLQADAPVHSPFIRHHADWRLG
jgi:NAD(P)H dehydrogenase (quinone)